MCHAESLGLYRNEIMSVDPALKSIDSTGKRYVPGDTHLSKYLRKSAPERHSGIAPALIVALPVGPHILKFVNSSYLTFGITN